MTVEIGNVIKAKSFEWENSDYYIGIVTSIGNHPVEGYPCVNYKATAKVLVNRNTGAIERVTPVNREMRIVNNGVRNAYGESQYTNFIEVIKEEE